MGRKKGGRNADTDLKVQRALEKTLKEHKSAEEIAKEEGVHQTTISRRVARALASEEVRSLIGQSRERLIKMLSRCDRTFLEVLNLDDPSNNANRIKVAQSIYRTFGVLRDQPETIIENANAIVVKVDGSTYEFIPPKTQEN